MEALWAIAAGLIGGGGLLIATKWLAPWVEGMLRGITAVRKELDDDRDRIIDNLREEIGDYERREADWARQRAELANELQAANKRIAVLESVTDELARRLGMSSTQIAQRFVSEADPP